MTNEARISIDFGLPYRPSRLENAFEEELKNAGFKESTVKSTANITFDIQYFKKLVPFPLYYGVYFYNTIERAINFIQPLREKHGSFVITSAKK